MNWSPEDTISWGIPEDLLHSEHLVRTLPRSHSSSWEPCGLGIHHPTKPLPTEYHSSFAWSFLLVCSSENTTTWGIPGDLLHSGHLTPQPETSQEIHCTQGSWHHSLKAPWKICCTQGYWATETSSQTGHRVPSGGVEGRPEGANRALSGIDGMGGEVLGPIAWWSSVEGC